MKLLSVVFFTALAALPSDSAGAQRSSAAQESPVTKTLNIKVPGKITFVYWSVQSNSTYIQISFPGVPHGQTEPEVARTQVWLLKSDGTAMPQMYKSPESPAMGISMAGRDTPFVIYTFPSSARTEAISVVVKVDDEFFAERLTPDLK
jgi:hypothetical protein